MTEYKPRTTKVQRVQICDYFNESQSARCQIVVMLTVDLAHAESCLAERDAEIERLRKEIEQLKKINGE